MGAALCHFIEAQVWCALLVLAFIGWGWPVQRWFTGSGSSVGLAACVGVTYLAPDPYSERRVTGGLGGGFLLQGIVESCLPLQNVQKADQSLGLVLTALVALALAAQFELSPLESMVFAIFSISIPPMERNLSYSTLPSSLFLALALVATTRKYLTEKPATRALLNAIIDPFAVS
jgi:hypothetical protein